MAHLCARNTLLVKLGVIARQPSLCLAVNTIFKHFGSNTVEFPPIVEFPMSATIISAAPIGDPAHSRRKLFRFVLFSLSAILAAIALAIPTRADEIRTLIIPPNDGYGFEECLKTGSQCGLVVADDEAALRSGLEAFLEAVAIVGWNDQCPDFVRSRGDREGDGGQNCAEGKKHETE